jgi:anti-anti-sigma regulatory factor
MTTNAVWLKIDPESLAQSFAEALAKLDGAEGELVLDFSAVRRIDSGAIAEMEKLAASAGDKAVKIALCGVHVDVYKVLKLVKLAERFTFLD